MVIQKRKIIVKVLAFGLIYPIVTLAYLPLLWLFSEFFVERFSCELLTNVLWYIVYAPCLISIGITKVLVPSGFNYFSVMIFFIIQTIVYYILGSLLADYLLWRRNIKKAS